jgi:hypothetical protein
LSLSHVLLQYTFLSLLPIHTHILFYILHTHTHTHTHTQNTSESLKIWELRSGKASQCRLSLFWCHVVKLTFSVCVRYMCSFLWLAFSIRISCYYWLL